MSGQVVPAGRTGVAAALRQVWMNPGLSNKPCAAGRLVVRNPEQKWFSAVKGTPSA